MCGIFGHFSTDFACDRVILKSRFVAALDSLHHRGPDNRGLESLSIQQGNNLPPFELTFGHTRLSIIDLSSSGHQPMHSSDGRFVIVYNGEIYNYKELRNELKDLGHIFNTRSDTEILIAAWSQWGPESLKKLIGMFAFAIFDKIDQTLTLARDAFGIKPLFYHNDGDSIYFASELLALIKLIPKKLNINLQRSYDYLVHNSYDSNSDTFFQEINHLLPAHFITFDLKDVSKFKSVCWWKPNITTNANLSFEEATRKLRTLFLDSVKLHLRSDVPLGVALSGGIDSSALASVVRYLEPNISLNTFSYIASDLNISEEKWIDLLNKKLNAKSHKITIQNHEIFDDLCDILLKQGEPFSSTSVYAQYRVNKLIKTTGVKVILDGQGADEILAGYFGYPGHRLLSLIETKGWITAHKYAKCWAQLPGGGYMLAWKSLALLKLSDWFYNLLDKIKLRDFQPKWLNMNYFIKYNVKLKKIRIKLNKENRGQRVKEALAYALTKEGLQSLLRHSDRNSMAFSIESRVPFLTIPIVEFLLSLPENYLISEEGVTKHIFREAMRDIVPNDILDRKDKIGFATPELNWLSSKPKIIKKWIEQSVGIPFINKKVLLKNFEKILHGNKSIDGHIWRSINYLLWYRLVYQASNSNF
jgi:asparagine synthase (glutamine-hydrolysing)